MKNVSQEIRKAFLNELDGLIMIDSVVIEVYNYVPYNAAYPYIRIHTDNQKQTQLNQSADIAEVNTKIEVVHRYSGDSGGQLIVEEIANKILDKIVGLDTNLSAAGLNNYTSTNPNTFYLEESLKDHSYYRAIIEIQNQVETSI